MVSNLIADALNAKVPYTTPLLTYTAHQRQSSRLFCPVLMVLLYTWLWSKRRAPKQDGNWEHPNFLIQNLFFLKQTILIQKGSVLETTRTYSLSWKQADRRVGQDLCCGHFGLLAQEKRDPKSFFPKYCKTQNYPVDTACPLSFIFQ